MTIKSDRWIRRMATEHGMIEPFENGQVRETGQGRAISYGLSSYGYDVRCSREFKIFTNVLSATTLGWPLSACSRIARERGSCPSSSVS